MENVTQPSADPLQATLELHRQQREAWQAQPAAARLASLVDTHAYMASFMARVPDERFEGSREREMARIKADAAALALGAAPCAERVQRFDQLVAAHARAAVEYGQAVSSERKDSCYADLTRLTTDILAMLEPDANTPTERLS